MYINIHLYISLPLSFFLSSPPQSGHDSESPQHRKTANLGQFVDANIYFFEIIAALSPSPSLYLLPSFSFFPPLLFLFFSLSLSLSLPFLFLSFFVPGHRQVTIQNRPNIEKLGCSETALGGMHQRTRGRARPDTRRGSLALTFDDLHRVMTATTYVRAHLRQSAFALLLPLSYGSQLHI